MGKEIMFSHSTFLLFLDTVVTSCMDTSTSSLREQRSRVHPASSSVSVSSLLRFPSFCARPEFLLPFRPSFPPFSRAVRRAP